MVPEVPGVPGVPRRAFLFLSALGVSLSAVKAWGQTPPAVCNLGR